MLTFLALLLDILSAACLSAWTPLGGLSTEPGTRWGRFQYCIVSKLLCIPVASKALEVRNSKQTEKPGDNQLQNKTNGRENESGH